MKNIIIFVLTLFLLYLVSSCNKDDTVSNGVIENHDILRTDDAGHILGGDYSDWCMHPAVDTFTTVSSFSLFIISNNIARLDWVTTKQYHCYGFDMERSLKTDTMFSKIGFITGAGTTNNAISYVYYDTVTSNASNYKYRLKVIDIYGNFKYVSTGINITYPPSNYSFGPAYPNPTLYSFKVKLEIPKADTVSLYFLNQLDTLFVIKNEKMQTGVYEFDISNTFYFYNVTKRLYLKSSSFSQSDSSKEYGDIEFKSN